MVTANKVGCPNCGSTDTDFLVIFPGDTEIDYVCYSCHKTFSKPIK